MGRGQPQYTMVTTQRRRSGCFAGLFHLIGGLFTFGLWPLGVWLAHLVGPRKRTTTAVYGQPQQLYPPQYQQPYYPPAQQQYGGYPQQPTLPMPLVPPPTGYPWRWDPAAQRWVTP
jgi:hypothetical protein